MFYERKIVFTNKNACTVYRRINLGFFIISLPCKNYRKMTLKKIKVVNRDGILEQYPINDVTDIGFFYWENADTRASILFTRLETQIIDAATKQFDLA